MKMRKTISGVMALAMALSAMSVTAVTASAETSDVAAISAADVSYTNAKTVAYDLTTPYNTLETTLYATTNNVGISSTAKSITVASATNSEDGAITPNLVDWLTDSKGRQAAINYDITDITIKITSEGGETATYSVSSDTSKANYDKTFDDAYSDRSYYQMNSLINKGYTVALSDFEGYINTFKKANSEYESSDSTTMTSLPYGTMEDYAIKSITVEYGIRAKTVSPISETIIKEFTTAIKNSEYVFAIGAHDGNGKAVSMTPYTISNKEVSAVATLDGLGAYNSKTKTYAFDDTAAGRLLKSKMDAYVSKADVAMKNSSLDIELYEKYVASGLETAEDFAAAITAEVDDILALEAPASEKNQYDTADDAKAAMFTILKAHRDNTTYLKAISDAELKTLCDSTESKVTSTVATGETVYTVVDAETTMTIGGTEFVEEDIETAQTVIDAAIAGATNNDVVASCDWESDGSTASVATAPEEDSVTLGGDFFTQLDAGLAAEGEYTGAVKEIIDTYKSELTLYTTGNALIDVDSLKTEAYTAADTAWDAAELATGGTGTEESTPTKVTAAKIDLATLINADTVSVVDVWVDGMDEADDSSTEASKKALAAASAAGYKKAGTTGAVTITYKVNVETAEGTKEEKTSKYTPSVSDTAKAADVFSFLDMYGVKSDKDSDNYAILVESDSAIKDAKGIVNAITTCEKALLKLAEGSISDNDKLKDLVENDEDVRKLVKVDTELDSAAKAVSKSGNVNVPLEIENKLWYSFAGDYDYRNSCYFLAEIVDTIGEAKGTIVSFHVDPNSLKKNEDIVLAYVDAYDAQKYFTQTLDGSMVLRVNGSSTNAFTNLVKYDAKTSTLSFYWDEITGTKFSDSVLYVRTLDFMSSLDLDMDTVQITIPDQTQFTVAEDTENTEDTDDEDIKDIEGEDDATLDEDGTDKEVEAGEEEVNDNVTITEPVEDDNDAEDAETGDDEDTVDDIITVTPDNGNGTTSGAPVTTTPDTGNFVPFMGIPALIAGVAGVIKKKIDR